MTILNDDYDHIAWRWAHIDPQWTLRGVCHLFAPFSAVEMEHESGLRETWWLNQLGERVCNRLSEMPPSLMPSFKESAKRVLQKTLSAILYANEAERNIIDELSRFDIRTLQCIFDQVTASDVISTPSISIVSFLKEKFALSTGSHNVLLSTDRALKSASQDWQEWLSKNLSCGEYFPSPFSECGARIDGAFPFDDFHFVNRFIDESVGEIFYVLVAGHHSENVGLYLPKYQVLLNSTVEQSDLRDRLFGSLGDRLLAHFRRYLPYLPLYLQMPTKRMASIPRIFPQNHFGHQLWNELSGVEAVISTTSMETLPEWWIVNNGVSPEIYGPIEAIFPEARHKIRRELYCFDHAVAAAYQTGTSLTRITREFVSKDLRERLKTIYAGYPEAADIAGTPGAMVVIFGLRTENRTIVDQPYTFGQMALHIAKRYPGSIIVIDGHNGAGKHGGNVIVHSHGEASAKSPPINAERAVVEAVVTATKGLPVTIIDNIGETVASSLIWGNRATAFITVWGAGLAKYRWASNLPGIILSNTHNLKGRPDFNIYFSSDYMEDPSEIYLPTLEMIIDRADAPRLIDVKTDQAEESFHNFDVDLPSLMALFDNMMEDIKLNAQKQDNTSKTVDSLKL